MFKSVFSAVILVFYLSLQMPAGQLIKSNHDTKEIEMEVVELVTEAVEDTKWLLVSSREELEQILGTYYTGPLLYEISDQAWDFVRVPNSWEYVVKAGSCKTTFISNVVTGVSVEVMETDEITGVTYVSLVDYLLINTDGGWKITARKIRPN